MVIRLATDVTRIPCKLKKSILAASNAWELDGLKIQYLKIYDYIKAPNPWGCDPINENLEIYAILF